MEVLVVVALIVVGIGAIAHLQQQSRRKRLMEKYQDEQIVERIMKKMVWQGMSAEQLIDSMGRPIAVDRKVYKTKTSETYKYAQNGKNRFRSRVNLENGSVVGWNFK